MSHIDTKDEEKIEHKTNYFETIVHFVKAGIGAGIFAMAESISYVGIAFGAILIIFLSVVCLYEQHVLLKCAKEIRKFFGIEQKVDYGETFQLALLANEKWKSQAQKLKILTNVFLILTQIGFCAVYFVFIGNTMKSVLEAFGFELSVREIICLALAPILMTSLITNLKFLAPCSAAAGVCMFIGISTTFYYISQDLPNINERNMIKFDITKIPLFFGTVIYIFEGIGLVLPLQNEMKSPKEFTKPLGVLNMGMLVLTGAVLSVGILGYWKYGDDVASSLVVDLPVHNWIGHSVRIVVSCGVILGFAIQFYVPIKVLLPIISKRFNSSNPFLTEILFRMFMLMLTFSIAILVPNLGILISLIGAVCSNSLALVFPVIIEYLVATRDNRRMKVFDIIKNIFILLLATIGFLSGGYESIRGIISIYQ